MRLALLPVALLASLVSYAIAQPQPPLHVVDRIPVDRAHRHTHGCTHGEAAKMPPNHPSEIRKRAIKEAREAALKAAQAAEKQQNRWVLGREDYLESLRINPLPDGKVHSDFDFTFDGPWYDEAHHVASNTIATHSSIVPPVLVTLLHRFRISSFHFTLSSGRWSPHWPFPPSSPSQIQETAASGIELVAHLELLENESLAEEQKRWNDFTAALGGLFCAGVVTASSPSEQARPTWAYTYDAYGPAEEHKLYYALLPRLSATCTESLTPFVALLPCTSKAGLGSLLNPHRLFDGDWTLLGVHAARTAEDRVSFRLQVGSVLDPVRKDRLTGAMGKRDFALQTLFGRELIKTCPVAKASEVSLIVPVDSTSAFSIEPSSTRKEEQRDGITAAVWNTSTLDEPLNVKITWPDEAQFRYLHPSELPTTPITIRRLLTGHGQERGKLGVEIVNHLPEDVEVVWVEIWPWWVRGFVHTLEATSTSMGLTHTVTPKLDYTPPIARQRPTTLQARLTLSASSKTRLVLSYEASYLWYTEYPADSHRGFEVPGAQVLLLPSRSGEGRSGLRLHTPTTLLSLPTPDFSMPYNVIILTSTVIALFFGRVMNGLVRSWRVVDLREEEQEEEVAPESLRESKKDL